MERNNSMPGGLIAGWNPTLRRALIVGVAVGLALFLLAGTLVQWRWPRFLFGSRPTGPQSSGPAAPWQSMVMRAFQEAAKIDKQAALQDVEADTPGTFHNIAYAGPVTGSLQVRFSFYRPNGDSFWIDFEDGDPARTQFVYPGEGRGSSGGQTNYRTAQSADQTYRQNVQSVKLSPRDAVERTWNLARTEADRHGLQGR